MNGYHPFSKHYLKERIEIIRELNKYAGSIPPEQDIKKAILDGIKKELCIDIPLEGNKGYICLTDICDNTGKNIQELKIRLQAYYINAFKPAFTGLSKTEKEFVITLYSNGILDRSEIRIVYPSLYIYLFGQAENRIVAKNDLRQYLQAYRESKVQDNDNSYLKEFYKSGEANSTNIYSIYYSLKRQEEAITPYIDNSDIYILDGVGAEYLPLIVELLKSYEYDTEFCDYSACHLPSITSVNMDYLSAVPYKEWYLNFDREVIHGDYYKPAINLRKAFDILEEKIKEIIVDSMGKRIVITSDHGATARARWTESKKKYDFSESDHEGRCCKISDKNQYEDTEDYIVYEDEAKPGNPYVIALNEQSLYKKPKYEDHGGATLEELLVPVVVAVPHNDARTISYKVIGEKLEVSGLDKTVSFIIIPDPDDETFVIEADGTKHLLNKIESVYSANLKTGKEQNLIVEVADKEYKFSTKSRAKKNMEGDDGFDD